ncbi:MAG: hypothetical protein AAF291_15240 [Pseudomonadota bacterium]
MTSNRSSLRAASALAVLAFALPFAGPAAAQQVDVPPPPELPPVGAAVVSDETVTTATVTSNDVLVSQEPMTAAQIDALPAEYRSLPVNQAMETNTVDADGVETITRTRRIANRAPAAATTAQRVAYPGAPAYPQATYAPAYPQTAYPQAAYAQPAYAPVSAAPMVLDRESWIAECERRTRGRDKNATGSIIGGLLGAIGGGVLGNRVWDSERLAGTLIGGGVGGLAGALIGSLFNGDKKDKLYDCEEALSTYLDQYGQYGAPRIASRVIAAPAPAPVAAYPAYGYGYAPQPAYYQPAQTMVMVPVTTYQPQRVIVRENVREETYEVPGAARSIPAPPPAPVRTAPRMIKRLPAPAPSPKMIKN